MKYTKGWAITAALIMGVSNTYAVDLPLSINGAQRNIDQLQRENQKKIIENEIEREKNVQQEGGETKLLNDDAGQESSILFPVEKITIENDSRYEFSPERTAIIKRYINTDMGQREVISLVRDLTNFYISKGYVTTQVTIVPGSLNDKELILKVLWGKVLTFQSNGEKPTWRERTRLFSALPFATGEKLNISDIDQGLDNLLRVSNSDKLDIIPAEENGFSIINNVTDWVFPLSLHAGINNSGYRESGWYQTYLNTSLKNILGLNDTFSYYYARNKLDVTTDSQSSKNFSFSLPLGYWLFETTYYQSQYSKVIGGTYGGYTSDGKSERSSFKASRTLFRNAGGKTSGYVKIEKRENKNAIFGYPIAVSSKDYASVNTGINWVGSLLGGWGYIDIGMTAGIPWFSSAWKDDRDLDGFDIDYKKYNGSVTWNKQIASFYEGVLAIEYELNSGFQFTNDRLVSDSKYSLGDEYTVRGFKDMTISADRALYLSNTIKFPLQIRYARIYQISPFTGFDLGMARTNCPVNMDTCERDYMSGATAGVKMTGKDFSTSFTAGWPIKKPASLDGSRIDDYALYFNFDVGF